MPTKVFLYPEALQSILQGFLSSISSFSPVFYYYFTDLYNTGLRCEELKNFDLWSFDQSNNICVQPLKGGNLRTGLQSDLSDYCIRNFTTGTPCYSRLSQSTLCYWLETFMVPHHIYHESKSLKTHLFRHNKAKQMSSLGFSLADIQTYFGEVNPINMKSYINSDLYYWG